MLFNSLPFILGFLPLTLLGYFVLNASHCGRAARGWLVLASLAFYTWWNPVHLPVLLGSLGANFGLGRLLAAAAGRRRRLLLAAGCTLNLGLLGYFKYSSFVVQNVNSWFGAGWSWTALVLPIGISFYTFQQIAYLVDVHRGRYHQVRFLDYSLFVTFFPQLIAGPIVHPGEILPQFGTRFTSRLRARDLALGFSIFALGLGKKVILADQLAAFVDPVFAALARGDPCTFLEAWLATAGYSLQLYFDFSGYSDMAIGLGALFGIRLPVNFLSPYRARSMIDFWRRWHITLSRFLRDYLYIPLGGGRCGPGRRYLNLFLTMGLGGLWHGAGWTFLCWGLLHGLYLTVNHAWLAATRSFAPARWLAATRLWPAAAWALTLVAVAVGWVFFRSPNVDTALHHLALLFGREGLSLPMAFEHHLGAAATWYRQLGGTFSGEPIVPLREWIWFLPTLVLTAILALGLPSVPEMFRIVRPLARTSGRRRFVPQWRPSPAWAFAASLLFCLSVFLMGRPTVFLYFQF